MLLTLSPISSYNTAMRRSADVVLFSVAAAVTVIFAAAAALSLALIASTPSLGSALGSLPANPWWFSYLDPGPRDSGQPVVVIAATLAAAAVGLAAAFRAWAAYRRGHAPVLPYLVLFLFTLGLECLRAPLALLVASDRSLPAAIVLTRAVYGGRFVGLLALLVAGLSCIDLKYRNTCVLGGAALLVSFAVASTIPIDRTVFLAELLWKLGDEQGVWFANLVISLLVLGAVVGGGFLKRNRRYFALAAGFLCLLAAREILFFGVSPARLAAGVIVLAVGIIVSLRWLSRMDGPAPGLPGPR